MKKPALICLLLCLFITPRSVNAQSLSDTKNIQIVIENLDSPTRNAGITTSGMSDQVLVALRRDVPKLKVTDDLTANNAFYVNISALELTGRRGFAAHLEVSVIRHATIKGDSGTPIDYTVTVWHTGMMFSGPPATFASDLRDNINQLVTIFAAQYYKDNP